MSQAPSTTTDRPSQATTAPEPPEAQNGPKWPIGADAIDTGPSDPLDDQDSPPDTPAPPLSQRQLAALELMLAGFKDTAIASQLKIGRRTLYRWRTHDPIFRSELLRRREALFGQSTDRFRTLLDRAMDALERQVKDKYNPTSHRAARTLLIISRIGQHLCPKLPDLPIPNVLHQSP